ncbi:hypothetical protein [Actinocrispum wychmicini]|uniref:Peptide zinc metalloprotease protein n=1 Tax=Actinocrispum wychmicini TaxID=1213861 RepID=A0A4V2S6H0_9PSEU|nr:hypothetical protein [Actinocrispum wychmicini]TCO56070.1 hypothetical protein EV192_107495 [Actinocrispum wychmicini]
MTETVSDDVAAAIGRLVVARDRDECVVGRPDLGVYVAVPEPGAVFVECLQSGGSLAEATALASEAAGAEVDGPDFLDGLAAAGLLDPPGQVAAATGRSRQIRWIEGVSPNVARRLFGRTAWTLYCAAAAFAVGILLLRPDLRPSFEDSWWLPDPGLSVLLLIPIWFLVAGVHEAWHWLAGRAVGVPAVFRVSYRGAFLVFETDLTQIVTVPRHKRYSPFLAGMAIDSVWLATALGLRLANRTTAIILPGTMDRLLAALVLTLIYGLVWQFAAVFMRSDMYAVLANALRCNDLYRATLLTNKDRLWRLSPQETEELATISEHDRRVARWFGVVNLAGMLAVGWVFLAWIVPFLLGMVVWVPGNLLSPDPTSVAFWESVALILVTLGQIAGPVLLALRERRLQRTGALR